MKSEKFEFRSQGAVLRGKVFLPDKLSWRMPAIIMAHGFTTTIEGMTADIYAQEFCKTGYAVFLYDHINLGSSGGEPRQEINFWVQCRGYLDCLEFVLKYEKIDKTKIGVWGASLSAREAFLASCIDNRIRFVIGMIPAFGDSIPNANLNPKAVSEAKWILNQDRIRELPHGVRGPMPIVSANQKEQASVLSQFTAYSWFNEYGNRSGTKWRNEVTILDTTLKNEFHVLQCAKQLRASVLFVVAKDDEMSGANPEVTKTVFKQISSHKEMHEMYGGHFGLLYHPSLLFDESAQVQKTFLMKIQN